ncbi:MAG: glycine/betaine ABC transporter permease, partial [Mesorhizobium sp.]
MTIGLRWVVDHYRPLFQSLKAPFDLLLQWFGLALHSVPPVVMIIVAGLAAWQFGGRKVAGVIVG